MSHNVSYVNSSAIASDLTGAASVTPTLPSHQTNDVLIAHVQHENTSATDIACSTSGWTEFTPSGGGVNGAKWFWKRAASGAETNPTFTSATTDMFAIVHNFRGCITTGTPLTQGPVIGLTALGVANYTGFSITGYNRLVVVVTSTPGYTGTLNDNPTVFTRKNWSTTTSGTDCSFTCYTRRQFLPGTEGTLQVYDTVDDTNPITRGNSFALIPEGDPLTTANTADGTSTSDTTPTFEFTGDSPNARDLRYKFMLFSSNSETLCDSWETDNSSQFTVGVAITDLYFRTGQSFTGNGGYLNRCQFFGRRGASMDASAQVVAKLYAHTGTFGSGGTPTGDPLAISDPITANSLSTTNAWYSFNFGPGVQLVNGTRYFIILELWSHGGGAAGSVVLMAHSTASSHGGNSAIFPGNTADAQASWTAQTSDVLFRVYTVAAPSQTRISGTDAGFANTVTGGDTDPFNDNEKVSYTIQSALGGGTYYWTAGATEPSGDNKYAHFTPLRSIIISANTTTTKTIDGKVRVQNTTTRTQTGKARVRQTVTRDQTGKVRVTIQTQQSQTGKVRIYSTTQRLINGLVRIYATTLRTISGKIRLSIQTQQNITGKLRVTAATLRTQLGKTRLQVTVQRTVTGKVRVTATTTRTQTGRMRAQRSVQSTITGLLRITASTLRTIDGKLRVTASTQRLQTGKLRVTASTLRTILGVLRVTAATLRTITGKVRVQVTSQQTQTGKVRSQVTTQRTITGVVNISTITATTRTILGKIRVQVTSAQTILGKLRVQLAGRQQTQTGKVRVQHQLLRTITGVTRVMVSVVQSTTGKVRVQLQTQRQQTGVTRVRNTATRDQQGRLRVFKTIQQVIPGIVRVQLVTTRNQQGKIMITATRQRTQQGRIRIEGPVFVLCDPLTSELVSDGNLLSNLVSDGQHTSTLVSDGVLTSDLVDDGTHISELEC